ncbi:MAG: nickel-dependent lactate racemase [Deltaproteobacteria bacterium]|nr:nickel-dependent lactate racemase [Deltaproteobacteria bacterium]
MANGAQNKRIILDYGKAGLEIEVPEAATTVIEPTHLPGLTDPAGQLRSALEKPTNSRPLRQCIAKGQRVAISICDITRPQPREKMLTAIFEALPQIPPEDFVILIATGTHRANTETELEDMLGAHIAGNYPILNHDGRDEASLVRLPDAGAGVPVMLNRAWVEADFRITTGFVEPHLFAGFSGGPKLVAPGLAGLETIMVLHSADRIRHPNAIWGITEGNPIHDDIRAISRSTGVDFSIDVVLNRDKKITGVFAGELFSEHTLACARAKACAMQPVSQPFDVVVTTNSGYPLDQNLYQAVKGMRAAHRVVAPGGSIICAAECSEGLPGHGSFADLLGRRESPAALLEMIDAPGFGVPDQWQVQVQALVQMRAQVYLKSAGLNADDLEQAHLLPADDVSEMTLRLLHAAGDGARLCVLPQGPQTIPFVA